MRTERLSRLGIDHVSVHHIVLRLEAAGLVGRKVDSGDRRCRVLRLTRQGHGLRKSFALPSCRTGPHPGAAGPGGAGLLCRHVRPNTTRHLFPRSPVDLTGGAPTFWSLERRCLRSWRRSVGRRRARPGCSLAGPHLRARVCRTHRRLENRCHHRDVVDTGTSRAPTPA